MRGYTGANVPLGHWRTRIVCSRGSLTPIFSSMTVSIVQSINNFISRHRRGECSRLYNTWKYRDARARARAPPPYRDRYFTWALDNERDDAKISSPFFSRAPRALASLVLDITAWDGCAPTPPCAVRARFAAELSRFPRASRIARVLRFVNFLMLY